MAELKDDVGATTIINVSLTQALHQFVLSMHCELYPNAYML